MPRFSRFFPWIRLAPVALLLVFACVPPSAAADGGREALARALAQTAPRANPKVLALATQALACVRRTMPVRTLSVIDYSLPSTTPRLWVFDLAHRSLLFHVLVAHGRHTGGQYAKHFSNREGSLMSSLGTFVTDGTYVGHNGYSLRLKGLDGRFNDQAEKRAIVIDSRAPRVHAAPPLTITVPDSLPMNTTSPGCASSRAGGSRSRAVPSVVATW